MGVIRINPNKMLVGGDKTKAKEFIGQANSQMNILIQEMSFQKLFQGVRQVWLNDDVLIECRKIGNYQECRIWVRPFEDDKEEIKKGVYYYIRIKNDGSIPGPFYFPEFKTDRIVIWSIGASADGGLILFDVDVENSLVYASSSTATDAEQILRAQEFIDRIDDPEQEIDNLFDDYFSRGDVVDPIEAHKLCIGFDVNNDDYPETDVDLSEFTSGYPHMMKTPDTEALKLEYCSNLGGDPTKIYDQHDWVELGANAVHYPDTWHNEVAHNADGLFIWGQVGSGGGLADYAAVLGGHPAPNTETEASKILANPGYFYSTDDPHKFPCFFILKSGEEMDSGGAWTNTGYWNEGGYPDSIFWPGNYAVEIGYGNGIRIEKSLITPLEEIEKDEYIEILFVNDDTNYCSTVAHLYGIGGCYQHYNDAMPDGEPSEPWANKILIDKKQYPDLSDDGYHYSSFDMGAFSYGGGLTVDCNIPNLDDTDIEDNYFSMLIVDNNAVWSKLGMQSYPYESDCLSGGDDYHNGCGVCYADWAAVPGIYTHKGGVAIYILQPSALWWENADTGETEFWDIHSAREANEGDVNRYRALDLEERVLEIIGSIQEYIDEVGHPDVLTNQSSSRFVAAGVVQIAGTYEDENYGFNILQDLGYEITQGFVLEEEQA